MGDGSALLGSRLRLAGFAGGALGLAVLLSMCEGGGSSGGDGDAAWEVQATCEKLVEGNLRNPTTARFSGQESSAVSASGMVVAENALGGKVTMTYRCTSDGTRVRLVALDER